MKYYECLKYQLSMGFKDSIALELLEYQLDKEPNSIFRLLGYKDEGYESFNQGDKVRYEIDENTGNINVFLETFHEFKKRFILFQLRRRGNEVNIITKTPREDSFVFHIRHNSNNTVTTLSKRIKFYGREDEQVLESRFALFSDDGELLDFNEQKSEEQSLLTQFRNI